jgi:hypothetical protein
MKRLIFACVIGSCVISTVAAEGLTDVIFGQPASADDCAFAGCYGRTEFQQIYSNSQFGGTPVEIHLMQFFRTFISYGGIDRVFGNWTIRFSTTHTNPDTMSGALADNVGTPYFEVFSGSLAFFLYTDRLLIPTASYLYDPAAGNLLMDVSVDLMGGNYVGGDLSVDSELEGCPLTSATCYDLPPGAATMAFADNNGVAKGYGLSTDFLVSPQPASATPEPDSLWSLGSALLGVGAWNRRRKRS